MKAIDFQHKEIIKKKIGYLYPGHKEWVKHMIACMGVDICPKCGKPLFTRLKSIKSIIVQCSHCDWEDSTEHNC